MNLLKLFWSICVVDVYCYDNDDDVEDDDDDDDDDGETIGRVSVRVQEDVYLRPDWNFGRSPFLTAITLYVLRNSRIGCDTITNCIFYVYSMTLKFKQIIVYKKTQIMSHSI